MDSTVKSLITAINSIPCDTPHTCVGGGWR